MALSIAFDEFEFVESEINEASKMSSMLKQPPVSPIGSESSSGISSLDSDDLKKQLLSSPTTVSNLYDHEDEELQSNDGDGGILNEKNDESDNSEGNEKDDTSDSVLMPQVNLPVKVIYQNRNILDLADNIWSSGRFIQYTVLPENNLSCFFQNRAQYWRLGSSSDFDQQNILEKCSCCDFRYPSLSQNGLKATNNNTITDSLLTFLKTQNADFNTMPNIKHNNNNNSKNINNNNNIIGNNKQRMYNNNNASYAAYQIMQQQQQQQYQNSGYQNNVKNGLNQQFNSFNNNGCIGNFNNNRAPALGPLNTMNQSRNPSVAFQQITNNNSRYHNNNNGLYKQF